MKWQLSLYVVQHWHHHIQVIIRLLIDSYVRQQACVSWNGFKSNYFVLQNRVKQGGMLSIVLFTMHIDNLRMKPKHSGYECHEDNIFCGNFMVRPFVPIPTRCYKCQKYGHVATSRRWLGSQCYQESRLNCI